jgi:polyphosphate kinase
MPGRVTAALDQREHLPPYVNRELSWLEFNRRVLDQAADPSRPLLERVKFVAIFGSNLDEFFMIRVSGLHEQLDDGATVLTPDQMSTVDQLAAIRATVQAEVARAADLLVRELLPELARHGIQIETWASLSDAMKQRANRYFHESVFPLLTPLAVDPVHPFPFLSNLSLSLAVEAKDPVTGERRFARIKVPESLPRFVNVTGPDGRKVHLLPLEELIAHSLDDLFPGIVIEDCHFFRVTRDMDIEILEEEASDLLSVVDRELRKRRFGAAVRLEVAPGLPDRVRKLLLDKLELEEDDLYETKALLGLSGRASSAWPVSRGPS